MGDSSPTISFCTTCHNRLYQLKSVFDANAAAIARNSDTDWTILNFNSEDNIDDFMFSKLRSCPPTVHYVTEASGRPWHLSVAKNIAHRLATGSVLVNLDCDNLIGDAIDVVRRFFDQGCKILHMWSGIHRDGTCGRIAVAKDVFYKLQGYDESFLPARLAPVLPY